MEASHDFLQSTLKVSSSMYTLTEPPVPEPTVRDIRKPFMIGVAGGACSGKREVCQMIMDRLIHKIEDVNVKVVIINLEDFYLPLSDEQMQKAEKDDYNFDHPRSIDFQLLESCIESLTAGKPTYIPKYDTVRHYRLQDSTKIECPDVVIFSGIYMLYKHRIRQALDLKVFVDLDSDLRLAQQVVRDTDDKFNKELNHVLEYYVKFVKPAFEDFILPSKKFADVIIPRGKDNIVAIELLTEHIVDIIEENKTSTESSSLQDVRTAPDPLES